ncbi:MAG: restriction endonuclease subunit S, partial [Chloroflexi bacterium]|nr:restriction endonuclease subunit S [Chloroflexota bacterium]
RHWATRPMVGIPARSDTFFRVGPAELGKAQCFAVKRGEVSRRADVAFHQPWIRDRLAALENSSFVVNSLGTIIAEIRYGTGSPPLYLKQSETTVPFVRATDIKNGEVNLEGLLHVAAQQPSHMDKCRLAGGELIIVRSGVNTGDCAVVPELLINSFAAYDLILTFQANASAKFVAAFLDTEVGRLQLDSVKGRSAQPHINAQEVAAIRVPLPTLTEQERLVVEIDTARDERKEKLAQADALLGGVDDFLLEALGIEVLPNDSRRVFAVKRSELHGQGRLNPDYYHPARTVALRSLTAASRNLAVAPLAAVASFERNQLGAPGENYLSLAHVQSHTGELNDLTVTATGNCFAYSTDDVLFARLRPYLNKVHRAETDGCCSTEFHVLRVKHRDALMPEYLATILRSRLVLAQTVHMMAGNTHPRLANHDVANLQIPIPNMQIQESIAAEVVHRREEARRFRFDAEAGWREAKEWFEGQLLGPVTA